MMSLGKDSGADEKFSPMKRSRAPGLSRGCQCAPSSRAFMKPVSVFFGCPCRVCSVVQVVRHYVILARPVLPVNGWRIPRSPIARSSAAEDYWWRNFDDPGFESTGGDGIPEQPIAAGRRRQHLQPRPAQQVPGFWQPLPPATGEFAQREYSG